MESEKITLKSLDARLKNLGAELDKKIIDLDSKFDMLSVSQQRMGVLMESMDGKLSLLLEGYIGHDKRITSLEDGAEKMNWRLDKLELS